MHRVFVELVEMFPQAVVGGTLIAVVCSLLGVFVVVRRIVFIGITLSEVAACGVAFSLAIHWPPLAGALLFTLCAVLYVAQPFSEHRVPRDAVLGVLFVGSAGLSILLVSGSGFGMHEVKSLMYGDLILTSGRDLSILFCVLVPVGLFIVLFLRPLLYSFADADGARVMGIRVRLWDTLFFIALGLSVSAASKVGGAMLVFAYLVVVPSAALMLSRRLYVVLCAAPLLGVVSTWLGLGISYSADTPTNPTLMVVVTVVFAATLVCRGAVCAARLLRRRRPGAQQS